MRTYYTYKNFMVLSVLLIILNQNVFSQGIYEQLAEKIDKVVALDSTGDYTSINDAINSVPDNNSTRVVIFVKNGVYEEKVEVASGKNNITLVGENIDSTIISFNDYSGSGEIYNGIISSKVGQAIGTSTSHTLYIDSDDFILMNLTVRNTAGPVGQAVALNLGGDKIIVIHCRILGNQDTFYTWGYGRFYIKDTEIEGNVDFIFGRGATLFDSCLITSNRSSSDITAASTDADWKFGYIFNHCKLSAEEEISNVSMGRPWKDNAQTVFMNTYQGSHIKAAGWSDWDGRSATCYYAEYNNNGPGWKPESRVTWAHLLSDEEAKQYTIESIFAKDVRPDNFTSNWSPDIESDPVYQIILQNTDKIIQDEEINKILPVDQSCNEFRFTNPFDNEIIFTLKSNILNDVKFLLYNSVGQKVFDKNYNNLHKGIHIINSSLFESGVYFYQIIFDNYYLSGKLIK